MTTPIMYTAFFILTPPPFPAPIDFPYYSSYNVLTGSRQGRVHRKEKTMSTISNEQKAHDIAIALASIDTEKPISSDEDIAIFIEKYEDYFSNALKIIEKS